MKRIKALNTAFISIVCSIIYIFGIGIAACIYRVFQHSSHLPTTYWQPTVKNKGQKQDLLSEY